MNAEAPNRIPWPPLIFATAVVAGLLAHWVTPLNLPVALVTPGFVLLTAGLALDVCVLATVLDARKEGFQVTVILEATRPITVAGGKAAIAEMKKAGAEIVG